MAERRVRHEPQVDVAARVQRASGGDGQFGARRGLEQRRLEHDGRSLGADRVHRRRRRRGSPAGQRGDAVRAGARAGRRRRRLGQRVGPGGRQRHRDVATADRMHDGASGQHPGGGGEPRGDHRARRGQRRHQLARRLEAPVRLHDRGGVAHVLGRERLAHRVDPVRGVARAGAQLGDRRLRHARQHQPQPQPPVGEAVREGLDDQVRAARERLVRDVHEAAGLRLLQLQPRAQLELGARVFRVLRAGPAQLRAHPIHQLRRGDRAPRDHHRRGLRPLEPGQPRGVLARGSGSEHHQRRGRRGAGVHGAEDQLDLGRRQPGRDVPVADAVGERDQPFLGARRARRRGRQRQRDVHAVADGESQEAAQRAVLLAVAERVTVDPDVVHRSFSSALPQRR